MAMSPRYVQYLLQQGDLLNRILAFNADFSARQYRQRAQTHPESIKDSLYVVHPELARFHEENNISYYFENNTDRLCLMKQSELETLLVYLGACINSKSLASVTLQAEKDQIYEQIGRDAYNFALDYGYLIKNIDFALNLDSLKQDCTYLGLCALKCIEPLFSSQELREYFIEMLLTFTKQHDLNPNIITSREHVLSIIYPVNDNIKAPSPSQMNNPAQFNTWENSTQMAAARDAIDDKQSQSGSKVVNGLASLIHAETNAPKPLTAPAPLPDQPAQAQAATQAATATPADTTAQAQPVANATIPAQPQDNAAAQPTADAQTATTATPDAAAATAPASDASAVQQTTDSPADAAALTASQPDTVAQSETVQNADAKATTTAAPTAAATPTDGAAPAGAAAATAAGAIDYNIIPEGVGAPLEVTYADAALYGSYIDKRKFRAASLKQRKDQKTILSGVRQEPQQVEEQQLITLEFGARQVFDLTAVILKFQIDEHWHEYLQE